LQNGPNLHLGKRGSAMFRHYFPDLALESGHIEIAAIDGASHHQCDISDKSGIVLPQRHQQ
jgi:hypothetical protein